MSSLVSERVLVDHRDRDCVVVFPAESKRVVLGCRFVLGRVSWVLVVCCGCVLKLTSTSPCAVMYFPLPPPSLFLSRQRRVGVVVGCRGGLFFASLLWLLHRDKMTSYTPIINVLVYFTLARYWVAGAVLSGSCRRDADSNVSISFTLDHES